MTTSDLTLSPTAAQRLHDLSKAEGHPVMLRVAVEGGGCSGFQYQFDLVSEPQSDDL
ncbi:MAG TPA: iron-sulfur cluster biosynthesis family protein, partial [Phenylobacterium sp.]|nr:iron-sulfur cluster biosynthesis family protein [Phenylobacterium sp.]